jgi:uncharacterized repeat protein (TIGR01451 family)
MSMIHRGIYYASERFWQENNSAGSGSRYLSSDNGLFNWWWLLIAMFLLSFNAAASYEAKIKFLDLDNNPVTNLTVSAGGKTATYSDGFYTINGLLEGSHTLSMSTSGYKSYSANFYVGANDRAYNGGNIYAIKTSNGYRVTGKVLNQDDSSGISGVNVSANGANVTTNASGEYSIYFSEAGNYDLSFSKSGYPTTTSSVNLSDTRPTANAQTWMRIGSVRIVFRDFANKAVSGLNVNAGNKSAEFSGDAYIVSGLAEGSYTLSMSSAGYKPVSLNFDISASRPQANLGFHYALLSNGSYKLSGVVSNENGMGVPGVVVSFPHGSATTGDDGSYSISFSEPGSYTASFKKDGYLDITRNFHISDSSPFANLNVAIVTGYTVSGRVYDANNQGLAGVTVQVAGQTGTTDGQGSYTITGIKSDGAHTLKLSKDGKSTERSLNISPGTFGYNMGIIYLVDGYLIHGSIYDLFNQPASGIQVSVGDKTAVTNAEGKYQITVPEAGQYSVAISQSGYKPVSTQVWLHQNSPSVAANSMYAISLSKGYRIEGKVMLLNGSVAYSNVLVEVAGKTARPNADGDFEIIGIVEPGTYTMNVTVEADGYIASSRAFSVSDNSPTYTGVKFGFASNINVSLNTASTKVQNGGIITYTVDISNTGNAPASEVVMWTDPQYPLPPDLEFITASVIGDKLPNYDTPAGGGVANNCNINKDTRNLTCKYLGSLAGQQTTQMKVVVGFIGGWKFDESGNIIVVENSSSWTTGGGTIGGGHWGGGVGGGSSRGSIDFSRSTSEPSNFGLVFLASGKTCTQCRSFPGETIAIPGPGGSITYIQPSDIEGGVIKSRPATITIVVEPLLSLDINGGSNQITVGNSLNYTITAKNTGNADITNSVLKITIPEQLALATANFDGGSCKQINKEVTCTLGTISKSSVTTVNLALDSVSIGQAKFSVSLASQQLPNIDKDSAVVSVVPVPPPPPPMPVGDAELIFIIDDTGSMGEELTALQKAITEYITLYGANGPKVGLVTFKDNVTNRIGLAATNNMSWLLNGYGGYIIGINQLVAQSGADCPEASLEALDYAKDLLVMGGRMVLVTDASPHGNIDVDELITALRAKGARVDVLLSGEECVGMCGVDTGDANRDSISAIEVFSRIAAETGGLFATSFEVNTETESGATHYQKTALNLLKSSISPTVIAVTPAKLPQNTTTNVVINAANVAFNKDSKVSFGNDIKVNAVEILSASSLLANITIVGEIGFVDATVTTLQANGESQVATGVGSLEVIAATTEAMVLGVMPGNVERGGNVVISIDTANTQLKTSDSLSFGADSGIVVSNLKIDSPTSLTATLDLSAAKLGTHKAIINSSGASIGNQCSMTASPTAGAIIVLPSIFEGNVPYITNVTPSRGTQGAVREISITAINTNFEQDITELRFGNTKIHLLKLDITSATTATALVQIDSEAELGLSDIYMYTGKEFVSALDAFEVVAKGPYRVEGCILDVAGRPVGGVRLDTGEQLGFSDDSCFFSIDGIGAGDHVLYPEKDGYHLDPVPFIVSENTAINGVVRLMVPAFSSALQLTSRADNWTIYQGESITHTITAFNYGTEVATGVVVKYQIHPGMQVENTSYLDGVTCSQEGEHLICNLPDMQPNTHNMFKLKLLVGETSGVIMSQFEMFSDQYPLSIAKNWITVKPYLSVSIKATPNPITPQSTLFYEVVAELSQYAGASEHLTATGGLVNIYLPENVAFESVDGGEHARCDTESLPVIKCQLDNLSIANAGDVSRAVINVRTTLQDPGLLLLVNQASIRADQFPLYFARSRTKIDVGDGTVDAAIVLDITGSMQSEINATVRAISGAIDALAATGAAPLVALVLFKDEVWVKAISNDLSLIRKELSKLEAEGGGHCPEASVEAIDRIIPHIKSGGTIIFATDSSPYPDSNIDALATKIEERGIHIYSLLSGDCSDGKAWNDLELEK